MAWLMLDGVGVGAAHGMNPFSMPQAPVLGHFGVGIALHESAKATDRFPNRGTSLFELEFKQGNPGEFLAHSIDARLGIPGLPQSGTGQTTLLTGINAAKLLGYHHGPWPGPTIRPLLKDSFPVRLVARGGTVKLLNHYPPRYLEGIARGKIRLNAIATAATLAGATLEAKDDHAGARAGLDRHVTEGHAALHRQRADRAAGEFHRAAAAARGADLANDRKHDVLGGDAARQRALDADAHVLHLLRHQTLRGEHMLDFRGAYAMR